MPVTDTIWNNFEATLRKLDPSCLPVDVTLSDGPSALQRARDGGVSQSLENAALSDLLVVPLLASLQDFQPWPAFVEVTPISYCRQNHVVALLSVDGSPIVAMASVDSWQHVDIISGSVIKGLS